ncbi:MAG: DUF3566 domain-containing protein [Propionibacteriaceae bacterium]|nr:DUF3566 domain-containing protein [Propionibacteriaceae bacterium]
MSDTNAEPNVTDQITDGAVPTQANSETKAPVVEPVTPLPTAPATPRAPASALPSVLLPQAAKDATPAQDPKKPGKTKGLGATVPARTRVRRVRLRLTRLDPLSMLRTSFLFAMSIAIAMFIVVCVVWGVIYVSGALESIQKVLDSIVGNAEGEGSINLTQYLQTWRVLGFSALLSVLNVVLLTLIGTVSAYIYNLAASIYGGIEMTLAEDSH